MVKYLMPCVKSNSSNQFISFKFTIVESKPNRVEKIEFKGLTGHTKLLEDLFQVFKKRLEKKEGICGKTDVIKGGIGVPSPIFFKSL